MSIASNSIFTTPGTVAVVLNHPNLQRRNVQLRADKGHVTLTGRVNSYFEKQVAQEAARAIAGVSSIDNHLEVCWPEPD